MIFDFLLLLSLFVLGIILPIFFLLFIKHNKQTLIFKNNELNLKRKISEYKVLVELNDKIGYSFDKENILKIIINSLTESINSNTVSYMLFDNHEIIFNCKIEKPVSQSFLEEVKKEMISYYSKTLSKNLNGLTTKENIWGDVIDEKFSNTINSSFIFPLSISKSTIGIIHFASEERNFYSQSDIDDASRIVKQASKTITKISDVIEREKSQLNSMVYSMIDGVLMVNMENQVIVANPSIKSIFGLEIKKNISLEDFSSNIPETINLIDLLSESIRLDKIYISDEVLLFSKFFKIIISPVKDRWRTLGAVIVFRNITKEKEAEKLKEDFTSMIVHELRSPLDAIKKITALMRQSELKKAEKENCLKMIYSDSSDMLELISNLLNVAKIEAGKFKVRKEKSDIKSLVLSRISFFETNAKDAKVNLSYIFSEDIPKEIEFDPHTISQVLNNLISNAIKFTKENGSILVQLLLHKETNSLIDEAKKANITWFINKNIENLPDSIILAITDNGIGISEQEKDALFLKFSQAKNIFIEKEGTGLGLAIVKNIVDSHGGLCGVESAQGKGSTFYFTIPI